MASASTPKPKKDRASDAPHYWEHRKRLKQKFLEKGLDSFHDYETVELLLTYGIARRDIKPLAKSLLQQFGSLRGILDASQQELLAISGMGLHTVILIKLVKEIFTQYLKETAQEKLQVTCTTELINYCKTAMGSLKDEQFRVIFLNAQNRIIDFETLTEGIVNQAVVYPRKVLEKALERKASAIILIHNHPSGHIRPSDADLRLTRNIQESARLLDILVHDHLIIGENRFFSFREEGLMP